MIPQHGLTLGGRYELTRRIAVGGMGEVWEALDTHLDRMVAAKVLRPEFAGDSTFLGRLRAEARNSAGLTHQNIAAMYDYGEQNGSGYLIMELVRGEPMTAVLEREGMLPPQQLLPILAQTARGLHVAHMNGVIHRDVKPANLLVTSDGHVKITDFGIALGANQAAMTATGMVMGTAQYLPPEQAMGRAATAAGDIYALGIIAYESLVGKRPFTGNTQVEIAFAHVNQQVPPLPDWIDPAVRTMVMSLLEKSPEDRPRSAAALARSLEELEQHLLGHAITAEPQERSPAHASSPLYGETPTPATNSARASGSPSPRIGEKIADAAQPASPVNRQGTGGSPPRPPVLNSARNAAVGSSAAPHRTTPAAAARPKPNAQPKPNAEPKPNARPGPIAWPEPTVKVESVANWDSAISADSPASGATPTWAPIPSYSPTTRQTPVPVTGKTAGHTSGQTSGPTNGPCTEPPAHTAAMHRVGGPSSPGPSTRGSVRRMRQQQVTRRILLIAVIIALIVALIVLISAVLDNVGTATSATQNSFELVHLLNIDGKE